MSILKCRIPEGILLATRKPLRTKSLRENTEELIKFIEENKENISLSEVTNVKEDSNQKEKNIIMKKKEEVAAGLYFFAKTK